MSVGRSAFPGAFMEGEDTREGVVWQDGIGGGAWIGRSARGRGDGRAGVCRAQGRGQPEVGSRGDRPVGARCGLARSTSRPWG